MTDIKKKVNKKDRARKLIEVNKFEKMFREIQVDPEKRYTPVNLGDNNSTWIISDNNSAFKSFVNHG